MFQIKENPPFLFTFLFRFPTGKLKQQRNFICQIHFHKKNKIFVGYSIFAFSFPKEKSNHQRTYISLKLVFCFKTRENLLHFPISYYVSIKFALCLPSSCAWFANRLCPEVPTLHSAAAVRRHCPQLMYAAKTTTNAAIVINPSQLS
jgi:hypothetical protein